MKIEMEDRALKGLGYAFIGACALILVILFVADKWEEDRVRDAALRKECLSSNRIVVAVRNGISCIDPLKTSE